MDPKQAFVLLSVFLSCYLIFSLSFVFAYQVSELQSTRVKFIIEPVLKIIDDLRPINCESSGYITFHAYVENVPEFDIKGSEAFVEDLSEGEYHNVTSSLSCFPKRGLISNQEITCTLKVNELLSRIPSCPFGKTENRLYLTLEISYGDRSVKVTDERSFVLTEPGTEPDLEIDFYVSIPPYDTPEINCRTGSEIEIPVVIKHAEILYGDITWYFSVNGTGYGGNLIECEKILTDEGEGREDIYLCRLVISNTAFTECEEGSEVWVETRARTRDHDISGNFSTTLVSQDLNLGIRVHEIEKLECQIIDENGMCVPNEPQQNVTVRITGNVPQRLKVFETRYKLGDANITTTYCRKIRYNKYECMAFITIDNLQMPPSKDEKTNGSRDLTVFFDVKYLNYYMNISDSITVEMEGVILDELVNTMEVLEKEKEDLARIGNWTRWINNMQRTVFWVRSCCGITKSLEDDMKEGGRLKERIENYFKDKIDSFIDPIESVLEWIKNPNLKINIMKTIKGVIKVIGDYGPGFMGCIVQASQKQIGKEQKRLVDFEEGQVTEELGMPSSFWSLLVDSVKNNFPECAAKSIWQRMVAGVAIWVICLAIVYGISAVIPAFAKLYDFVCKIINFEIPIIGMDMSQVLQLALDMGMMVLSVNQGWISAIKTQKSIALARERINLQVRTQNIMGDYAEVLANTMETALTGSLYANTLIDLTGRQLDTIKLIFISDRTEVLDNGDEICTNDRITIDYNFEKLNQTEDFISRLTINPSRRGPLIFDDLKGTYGPYPTDTLLGTNPGPPDFDPSETYTFTLSYQGKTLDYELYYVNHTC